MFGYISLHSAILVPNNSFIMLVNILLFQHYSCQTCNLLFSKLCQHNRLRPTSDFCDSFASRMDGFIETITFNEFEKRSVNAGKKRSISIVKK